MRPVLGYTLSAMAASVFFITWRVVDFLFSGPPDTHVGFRLSLGFAVFFWLMDGFCATLFVMVLPWFAALWAFNKLRWSGRVCCEVTGAIVTLITGSAMTSLAPKPFWIEDQTFLEGFLIGLQRQGLSYFLAGLLFGLTYWLLAVRHPAPQTS